MAGLAFAHALASHRCLLNFALHLEADAAMRAPTGDVGLVHGAAKEDGLSRCRCSSSHRPRIAKASPNTFATIRHAGNTMMDAAFASSRTARPSVLV